MLSTVYIYIYIYYIMRGFRVSSKCVRLLLNDVPTGPFEQVHHFCYV